MEHMITEGAIPYRGYQTWYRIVGEEEEAGTTSSPEYEDAMQVFYDRHVLCSSPYPDYVLRTFEFLGRDLAT